MTEYDREESRSRSEEEQRPVRESGEGEAEGFEEAERQLQEIAEHGDQHRFPDRDVPAPEEQAGVEYAEPDEPIPPDGPEEEGAEDEDQAEP